MNLWYSVQIDYLLFLQHIREVTGGVCDNFFMNITHLGEVNYLYGIIAGIYWCINTQLGMFICLNLGISSFLIDLIKNIACIYRPWILDSRIHPVPQAIKMAGGYSFPSGHTQNAVSVWGSMACWCKNKIITYIVIILILFIGFSRNYLGVHTPQDVLFSLIFTTILIFFTPKFLKWVNNGKNRDIMVFGAVVSAVVACVFFEHFKSYPMDYVNGELLVNPSDMRISTAPKLGTLTGVIAGWLINRRFISFDGSVGNLSEKLLRFLVGVAVIYCIYYKGTDLLIKILPLKYALFTSSFAIIIFITVIYPLIIAAIRRYAQKLLGSR